MQLVAHALCCMAAQGRPLFLELRAANTPAWRCMNGSVFAGWGEKLPSPLKMRYSWKRQSCRRIQSRCEITNAITAAKLGHFFPVMELQCYGRR